MKVVLFQAVQIMQLFVMSVLVVLTKLTSENSALIIKYTEQ